MTSMKDAVVIFSPFAKVNKLLSTVVGGDFDLEFASATIVGSLRGYLNYENSQDTIIDKIWEC